MSDKPAFDDRPDEAQRLQRARVARGFATAAAAARYFGWNVVTYQQHESGERGLSRSSIRYANAFRVSQGWLLTGEGEAPALPKVPVLGIVAGSITGQNVIGHKPLGFVPRTPALESVPDAYACWVKGRSMEPAFREGALVFAHPHIPAKPGDHIIVQQRNAKGEPIGFIKELVSYDAINGEVIARQYNHEATIRYPRRTVVAVHKVLTTLELFS